MPLYVAVLAMSGETIEHKMASQATVSTLKRHIYASTNVKPAQQALIQGSRCLDDSEWMVDLVEWFVLGDVMGEGFEELVFELPLTMVALPKLCGYCAERAGQKCGRCKIVAVGKKKSEKATIYLAEKTNENSFFLNIIIIIYYQEN